MLTFKAIQPSILLSHENCYPVGLQGMVKGEAIIWRDEAYLVPL